MSGLDSEQLDELVWRIEDQLEEPWHKLLGRPKDLYLREAVIVGMRLYAAEHNPGSLGGNIR